MSLEVECKAETWEGRENGTWSAAGLREREEPRLSPTGLAPSPLPEVCSEKLKNMREAI